MRAKVEETCPCGGGYSSSESASAITGGGSRPEFLMEDVHISASVAAYDLTSDGERLLFIEPLESAADQPISVVLNSTAQ